MMKRFLFLLGLISLAYGVQAQTKTKKEDNSVNRKVLLEQFTTEYCGYCPGGARRIKAILSKPDYKEKVIWIAHHIGYYEDSYTISDSKKLIPFYGTEGEFAPAMMMDRTYFKNFSEKIGVPIASVGYANFIENMVKKALAVPTFITVNIEQENKENDIKIKVTGSYKGTLPTENLFVSVYITEDGIISTNQAGTNGKYTHNHVIRKMLGGINGTQITWNGNNYSIEVKGKLDSSWNKDNLNIIAFVAKSPNSISNANVLNTEKEKFKVQTGINPIYAQSLNIFVNSKKVIVNGNYTSLNVFTIDGKKVTNNNLKPGIYLVRVKNNADLAVKKVIVY